MTDEYKHAGGAYYRGLHQDTWESRVLRALTFIVIGGVLLLNTTGTVSWGIWWNLVRLWPLWLIVIGINIVLGWSRGSRLVSRFLTFLVFVFILFMSIAAENPAFMKKYGLQPPDWATRIVSFKRGGGEIVSKTITIKKSDYGAVTTRALSWNLTFGTFTLKDGAPDHYLQLKASTPGDIGEPRLSQSLSDGFLDIRFDTESIQNPLPGLKGESPRYDFTAGMSGVRTDLSLSIGAGSGTVDIKSMRVGRLSVQAEAGNLDIALGEGSLPLEGIRVKVGAGRIKLSLPAWIGYRLDYTVGIGTVKVPGETFSGLGNSNKSYASPNFGTAAKTVIITAEVGVGSFEITTR
jgi:Cell wall-active antibiotics response LiaF, C-terminal/LiaI-LiaF-like transmembrane region